MSVKPLSGTTISTFGINRSYPKSPQVASKVTMYKSNGTGRDSYITKNNGGFSGINETPFRTFSTRKCIIINFLLEKISQADAIKKPAVNCKVPIYKNNGFGRDTYISY
jgi:hypothetical protein